MALAKSKNPHPDSMALNHATGRLLTGLVATGVISSGDKAISWYRHLNHCRTFVPVAPEKFALNLKNYWPTNMLKVIMKVCSLTLFYAELSN